MLSNSTHAASFIPILYTTLQAAGLSDVGITCCDATGWDSQKNMTADLVSAGMEKYLSHITSHGYTSEPDSVMNTTLKVWLSENADVNSASCPGWYDSGATCEGLTWAQNIYTGMTSANLSAYLYWEGLEVNQTDSSAHLIDTDGTSVTPSGRLWALAMWSRFIRPGAYRVSTTGTVSGVGLAAFKNTNGNVVVVFTNTGSSAKTVEISFNDFTPSSAIAYLTDNDHQVAETTSSLSGGVITVSVSAYSVVTVKVLSENDSVLSSTVTDSISIDRSSSLQHTTTSSWTSSSTVVPTLTVALNSTMPSVSSTLSREQASVQDTCDGTDLDD
jgi:O-glycosyl hydrolase